MSLELRLRIDYYVGGAAHILIKPLVMFLGAVMRRDHRLESVRQITILKLMGGGSLVIAYPTLLALKARAAPGQFRLVTLASTRPFAEMLGVFDEIISIREGGASALLFDSLHAIRRVWRCDALIDFEVHSRLSTIFCLLTCARNRIGFYTQESFWRRSLATHLLFFHLNSGAHFFYDQVAKLLSASSVSYAEAAERFHEHLALGQRAIAAAATHLAIAPCCSDLSRERMIQASEWMTVVNRRLAVGPRPTHIDVLGGPTELDKVEAVCVAIRAAAPDISVVNHAGKSSLIDSIRLLWNAGELMAIDSSLLHIARLLRIPCTSFWGPTSPKSYLHPMDQAPHRIHYEKLPCSPCVHLNPEPPCHGQNLCMRLAVNPDAPVDRNPPWLAQRLDD